ncbi:acyl carrier protein [Patescibacteria group bacterium]|nr:acyl carrier protein [Patescibacteria group bacterium]MBU4162129.1 acyl carrier protein [Patescibacteria group bacterium]
MTREDIRKKVVGIVMAQLYLTEEPGDSDDLRENLGADSLDAVEIIMEIEDELSIYLPDEQAQECTTLKKIVDLVETILLAKSS